jgi:hypothetical protein
MKDGAENSIAGIKIVEVDGPEGPTVAMMIAVDIRDPTTARRCVHSAGCRHRESRRERGCRRRSSPGLKARF